MNKILKYIVLGLIILIAKEFTIGQTDSTSIDTSQVRKEWVPSAECPPDDCCNLIFNPDFEVTEGDITIAGSFEQGMVCGWDASHGSPQMRYDDQGNYNYVWMWNEAESKGEGIFTDLVKPVVIGETYKLRFEFKTNPEIGDHGTNNILKIFVCLTTANLPSNNDNGAGEPTPFFDNVMTEYNSLIIYSSEWATTNNWEEITVNGIIPYKSYDKLVIFPISLILGDPQIPGSFQAWLSIDNIELREVTCNDDIVIPQVTINPVQDICLGEEIQFSAQIDVMTALEYLWNFGDGTTSTQISPIHTYSSAGDYSVTLEVVSYNLLGNHSCPGNDEVDVTVYELPEAPGEISGEMPNVCAGSTHEYNITLTGASYEWSVPAGSTISGQGYSISVTFGTTSGQISVETYNASCASGSPSTISINVTECPCCEQVFSARSGQFYYNNLTGQILYNSGANDCPGAFHVFECLSGNPVGHSLPKVVSASAITYLDEWSNTSEYFTNYKLHPLANFYQQFNVNEREFIKNASKYEKGEANRWRTHRQYVFREALDVYDYVENPDSENQPIRNYNRGTFSLQTFNWDNISSNDEDKWVWTSQTNKYSPNGQPMEDENILEIKSTAQYGYNNTLLTAVAQNASDHSVAFSSFENLYNNAYLNETTTQNIFDNGLLYSWPGVRQTDHPHTGKYSIRLKDSSSPFLVGEIKITEQILEEGILIRSWVWISKEKENFIDGAFKVIYWNEQNSSEKYSLNMKKVTGAGEWELYEALILPENISDIYDAGLDYNVMLAGLNVDFDFNPENDPDIEEYEEGDIYIDDVRIQPLLSEMVCYVYDEEQRLTAVLDDQHFAMIYQYNAEGQLVRKLKETVNGIKTISETQYNTVGQ